MHNNSLTPIANNLVSYCQSKLGFKEPPSIHFEEDEHNANVLLGKTAYYSPEDKKVVVYVTNRHPKDVLRSLAHELVHHNQNCRGEFTKTENCDQGYAQNDPHLRNMEKEAYLKGNILFRDWEDGIKLKINENILKESKKMNEDSLKTIIREELTAALKEGKNIADIEEGLWDRIRSRVAGAGAAAKAMGGNIARAGKYVGTGDTKDLEGGKNAKAEYRQRKADSMIKSAAKKIMAVHEELLDDLTKTGLMDKSGDSDILDVKSLRQGLARLNQGITIMTKAASEKGAAKIDKIRNPDAGKEPVKEEELDEGGAAQRQGNEDRLRRQEPDRMKEAYDHIPGAAELKAKIKAAKEKGDMETVKKLTKRMQDVEDYYLGVREEQELEEVDIMAKKAGKTAADADPMLRKPVRAGDQPRKKPKTPGEIKGGEKHKKNKLKEGSMTKTDRFAEREKVKHKEEDLGTGIVVSRKGKTVQVKWPSGQRSHDHNMLSKVNEENTNDYRIPENENTLNESLYGKRRLALNKRLVEWAKK